jgi:hypothetical protein
LSQDDVGGVMNATLEQALAYADEGYAVFPVHTIHGGKCTCKRRCHAPGKHPKVRGGFKSASTNQNQIRNWFDKDANIGIATGKPSGLVVIDVDQKNGGYDSLEKLERANGAWSEHTLIAHTGGGGIHLYYRHQGDEIRSRVNALGRGIDIRAEGGYVVASPSMHSSGQIYSWSEGFYPPPELPYDLEEEIRKNPANNGYSSAPEIPEGQRNQTLFNMAASLRGKGCEHDEILIELAQANAARCKPLLHQSEVASIAASVSNRYKKRDQQANMRTHWLSAVFSDCSGLKANVKATLAGLHFYMDEDGANCHPSQELLAKRVGCTRQAIASNLKLAEQHGWIKSYRIANESSIGFHFGYIATIPT